MFGALNRCCVARNRIFCVLYRGKRMAEDTGDRTWGNLASTEHFGRVTTENDYIIVKKNELNKPLYKDCTQAGHCLIFARNDVKVFGIYHPRAAVLMQMRFDGYVGFPGGLIDSGEDIIEGLNRELVEEVNLDLSKHKVTTGDYIVSHYCVTKKICLHFYALELTLPDLCEVEHKALDCKDYGSENNIESSVNQGRRMLYSIVQENGSRNGCSSNSTQVLGTIRVPLYIMGDGHRGFPVFLNNTFIGNARNQLLYSLKYLKLMTENEIDRAVVARDPSSCIDKTK